MDFNELNVPALNIAGYDHVAHLSYVDLDGFACSTIIHEARQGNVWQISAQDRKGIDKAIDKLIAKGKDHKEGTLLILITGLYVNKERCDRLNAVNTGNVDVMVISTHHIEDPAVEDYSWYCHNKNVSATELLYAAIFESATDHISYFNEFVKAVSAYGTFDRTNGTVFDSGVIFNDSLYMFLEKLKKDDKYTRDIVIGYLVEVAKVVEEGMSDLTHDIKSDLKAAWKNAIGIIGTETVTNALARNLATRVLEDRSNRYEVELDDSTYRCAVVGVLPFESDTSHYILRSDVNDVDFVVSINIDKYTAVVCSKESETARLFYKRFETSDILDAVICNDLYTAIEELGFIKAD